MPACACGWLLDSRRPGPVEGVNFVAAVVECDNSVEEAGEAAHQTSDPPPSDKKTWGAVSASEKSSCLSLAMSALSAASSYIARFV